MSSSSEETYIQTDLLEWTKSVVGRIADRIRRGSFESVKERHLEICLQISASQDVATSQKFPSAWEGFFSPRERGTMEKLWRNWAWRGGREETYQEFSDKLLLRAEALAKGERKIGQFETVKAASDWLDGID